MNFNFSRRSWSGILILTVLVLGSGAALAGLIRKRQTEDALQQLRSLGGSIDLACPHWCPKLVSDNMGALVADQLRIEFVDSDVPLLYVAQQLRRMPQDICLSLQNASLRDFEFEHLRSLPNLVALSVTEASMTDRSLAHLAKLPRLKCLSINARQITRKGCRLIADMRQLEHLGLRAAPLTDGDIQQFAKLSDLTILDLRGTLASDGCLESLGKLPRLTSLDLRATSVTPEGIGRLRKSRPDLEVHFQARSM